MAISDREWGEIVSTVDTLKDEVSLLRKRSHELANTLSSIQGEAVRAIQTAQKATTTAEEATESAQAAARRLDEAKKDPSNWPIMKRDVIVGFTSAATVVGIMLWILKVIGKI